MNKIIYIIGFLCLFVVACTQQSTSENITTSANIPTITPVSTVVVPILNETAINTTVITNDNSSVYINIDDINNATKNNITIVPGRVGNTTRTFNLSNVLNKINRSV